MYFMFAVLLIVLVPILVRISREILRYILV
jgi:hypothetical protein